MNVAVTGASGFVGNHVIEALLSKGHTVTGLSRTPPSGARLHKGVTYRDGVDVADASTLTPDLLKNVEVVIHLVGIIMERGPKQTFTRIHVQGTENVVNAARSAGVRRIIYLSAIGSDPNAAAEYSRTKAAAEEIVCNSGLEFVILRPSIILGKDGEFVAQMRDLVKYGGLPVHIPFPVIPVPGNGQNRFQPIYVDDLSCCIARAVSDEALTGRTIELGGATQVTFDQLIEAFAQAEHVRKPKLHAPIPLLALAAPIVQMLPNPPFSSDQLKNLKRDNITDIRPMEQAFEIRPESFESAMSKVYA